MSGRVVRYCTTKGCMNEARPRSPRCDPHTKAADTARRAKRGNYYTAWGYRARRKVAIQQQPWCSICGATTDLTTDHVVAKDPLSPLRVLCRSCNSVRANRARARGAGGAG